MNEQYISDRITHGILWLILSHVAHVQMLVVFAAGMSVLTFGLILEGALRRLIAKAAHKEASK